MGSHQRLNAEILYRTRPYVCGALGSWRASVLDRLRRAAPVQLREVHSSTDLALLASGRTQNWKAGGMSGYFWGALASGSRPRSWRDASNDRLAAGVQTGPGEVVLHTDALGMQELYVRRVAGALYFSVRVEPLLDIDDAALHTNWSAWADVLAVTAPLGEATLFQEISRLPAATGYRATANGIDRVGFTPSWMDAEPDPKITPEDAVDVVTSKIGDRQGMAITLSGGWDSRLLALLAKRRGIRPVAWTTSKDDGYDHDLEYAGPVARALRLKHRVIVPGEDAWLENHRQVRRRLSFQTNHHTWQMPLARKLHEGNGVFLDGLGGDVLFRDLALARWDAVDATTPEQQRSQVWDGLSQNRLRRRHLLAPGVAALLEEMSRASFNAVARRFEGFHDPLTLDVIHTRTARAISISPQWLLAPEVDIEVPFVAPDVLTVALSVPIDVKSRGTFFREMMFAVDPRIAALPSTNDGQKLGRAGNMRQRSTTALALMAASILARTEVAELLGPEMRRALKDPDGLAIIARSWGALYVLQWAAMLADWRESYASRLADDRLAGW